MSRTADTELTALNDLKNPGLVGFGINPLQIPKRSEHYIALCSRLAGLYVLDSARDTNGAGRSVLSAAQHLQTKGR